MRKIAVLWLVSLLLTTVATHLLTVRFGTFSWKNAPDENVDMIYGVAVPASQATPKMDEAYFRKRLFGEEMGQRDYPCAIYGTKLGYRGLIVSKKPLALDNPFQAVFQLW